MTGAVSRETVLKIIIKHWPVYYTGPREAIYECVWYNNYYCTGLLNTFSVYGTDIILYY